MSLPTLPLSSLPQSGPSSSSAADPSAQLTQRQIEAFINLLSTALAHDQAEELHRQRLRVISDWATPRRADQSGLTLMRKIREFEGLSRQGKITGEQMAKLRRLNTMFRPRAYQLLAVSHDRKVQAERRRSQDQQKMAQMARLYQQQMERENREKQERQRREQQRQLQAMMAYNNGQLAQGGSRTSFSLNMPMPGGGAQGQGQGSQSMQGPTSMDVLSDLFLRPSMSSPSSMSTTPRAQTPMYTPGLPSSSPTSASAPSSSGGFFFPSPSPPSTSSDAPSPATPPSLPGHGTHTHTQPTYAPNPGYSQSYTTSLPSHSSHNPNPHNPNHTHPHPQNQNQNQNQLLSPSGINESALAAFPDMNADGTAGEDWWTDASLMEAMCKFPGPGLETTMGMAMGGGGGMGGGMSGVGQDDSAFDFSRYVHIPEDE